MPPSPKKIAWIASATEIARIEPHGPSTTAATPMPTAWPVVPPGSGRLNIITTNENAENSDKSGTKRACSSACIRCMAMTQNGVAAAYSAAHVEGLR